MAVYDGARPRPGIFGRGATAPRKTHVVERPKGLDRPATVQRSAAGARPAQGNRSAAVARPAPGLRPAHATLPIDRRPAADSVPRRRARTRVRAGRRSGRLGLLLGGIVLAFLLAFFSLSQTVRVTATDYEVNRLLSEQAQLLSQRQELLSDLNRLGREPAVRKQAIDYGLFPLAEPVVLRAR
jgi:hypothetical protein